MHKSEGQFKRKSIGRVWFLNLFLPGIGTVYGAGQSSLGVLFWIWIFGFYFRSFGTYIVLYLALSIWGTLAAINRNSEYAAQRRIRDAQADDADKSGRLSIGARSDSEHALTTLEKKARLAEQSLKAGSVPTHDSEYGGADAGESISVVESRDSNYLNEKVDEAALLFEPVSWNRAVDKSALSLPQQEACDEDVLNFQPVTERDSAESEFDVAQHENATVEVDYDSYGAAENSDWSQISGAESRNADAGYMQAECSDVDNADWQAEKVLDHGYVEGEYESASCEEGSTDFHSAYSNERSDDSAMQIAEFPDNIDYVGHGTTGDASDASLEVSGVCENSAIGVDAVDQFASCVDSESVVDAFAHGGELPEDVSGFDSTSSMNSSGSDGNHESLYRVEHEEISQAENLDDADSESYLYSALYSASLENFASLPAIASNSQGSSPKEDDHARSQEAAVQNLLEKLGESTGGQSPVESTSLQSSSFEFSLPSFEMPEFNFETPSFEDLTRVDAAAVDSRSNNRSAESNDAVCGRCGSERNSDFSFCLLCGISY